MVDPYRPELWHDFFIAGAGSAAALTGLLFVSLSLHVRFIASSNAHRNTARGSLIGLVLVLVLSLVVLVHQLPSWTGVELAIVNLFYIGAVGTNQVSRIRRTGTLPRASLYRSILGYLLAAVGVVGGYDLYAGIGPGLYLIAFQVLAIIVWNLRNAWFLLMGVADEDLARSESATLRDQQRSRDG
jgi:hypothetical protein